MPRSSGMVAHGIITGLLFFLAGSIQHRYHTREMARLGANQKTLPILGGILGFAVMASLGLPGLAGFWGELMALLGAFNRSRGRTWPCSAPPWWSGASARCSPPPTAVDAAAGEPGRGARGVAGQGLARTSTATSWGLGAPGAGHPGRRRLPGHHLRRHQRLGREPGAARLWRLSECSTTTPCSPSSSSAPPCWWCWGWTWWCRPPAATGPGWPAWCKKADRNN